MKIKTIYRCEKGNPNILLCPYRSFKIENMTLNFKKNLTKDRGIVDTNISLMQIRKWVGPMDLVRICPASHGW